MSTTTTKPYTLHLGDCLDVLRTLPDNSVDSVVTDPPYGIRFMGKAWDGKDIEARAAYRADMPSHCESAGPSGGHRSIAAEAGKYDLTPAGMRAFQAFTLEWASECLRVLKPGGHLLSFAAARTYHHMAVGIEMAGFEIRDQIMWVFGSGFPKSMNVGKAIDKSGAHDGVAIRREIADQIAASGLSDREIAKVVGRDPRLVQFWREGRRSISPDDAKKLHEILACRIPPQETRAIVGAVTDRRKDETVYGVGHSGNLTSNEGITSAAREWDGWGTALKPAHEPICMARKPLTGTVAANVLEFGTGAINIDACRVPTGDDTARISNGAIRGGNFGAGGSAAGPLAGGHEAGRWPANLIHDGSPEVVAAFPDAPGQQGDLKGHSKDRKSTGIYGDMAAARDATARGDIGSAARFFYCAKASRRDRNEGLVDPGPQFKHGTTLRKVENTDTKGNNHPTVKPTELMAYLLRLVTPPGGVTLDPFLGSGSTGKAAMQEGFQFIGIEMEAPYLAIADARIRHECARVQVAADLAEALARPAQADLFEMIA